MANRKVYRIHPGVGIARMGSSPDAYFLGPEAPTLSFVPKPDGSYRDVEERLKRQAQRFRIYELTFADGATTPASVREITAADGEIEWTVHLVNAKAFEHDEAQRTPIDPGPVALAPAESHREVEGAIWGATVRLATLRRDTEGRLLVLGSFGKAGNRDGASLGGLRNPKWWDDVSDGPVSARLRLHGGGEVTVEPAWGVTGVPAYAAPLENLVTVHDLAFDVAVRRGQIPRPRTSFQRNVYPILRRVVDLRWASSLATRGHGPGADADFFDGALLTSLSSSGSGERPDREWVWRNLKRNGGRMPLLQGLDLTDTQYELLDAWQRGDFDEDWSGPPQYPDFEDLAEVDRPAALDEAALGAMVGGSFVPGIEVCSNAGADATWGEPFRVEPSVAPGHLTRELAVPWQRDYVVCGSGWWPGGRPNRVTADGTRFYPWYGGNTRELFDDWPKLGFLKRVERPGGTFVLEDERVLPSGSTG